MKLKVDLYLEFMIYEYYSSEVTQGLSFGLQAYCSTRFTEANTRAAAFGTKRFQRSKRCGDHGFRRQRFRYCSPYRGRFERRKSIFRCKFQGHVQSLTRREYSQ